MRRTVTLTDKAGNRLGTVGMMEAHTGKGALHRAFSVYVFNPDRTAMIIQKRSDRKMLWPEIWANTCCSHPLEGEASSVAGERRLQEELGLRCPLIEGPSFIYRAIDPGGRGLEHEFVRILVGTAHETVEVHPDRAEVADWKWIPLPALRRDMERHPHKYAPWFHLGLKKIL